MIRGNTSDFIGHPLPKDSISDPQMGPPTTPGPPPSKSGAGEDPTAQVTFFNKQG